MKIAIFTDTYLPQINGVAISTQTFVREFEKLGHQVVILGPKTDKSTRSTGKIWRFKSMPFPFQPEYRIISPLSRKLRLFGRLKFDVIHIQTPFFMGHLGQYMAWKHKIPVVHTYHTFWAEYLHYFPLIPKRFRQTIDLLLLSKNFCNRCDHIFVPTNEIQSKLLDYGVTTPLTVLPTGIDLELIKSHSDVGDFRAKYGIKSNQTVLIFVGRLGQEKNVEFLLRSFALVHSARPTTRLLLVGDGPERDHLLRLANELGIHESIVLTGYLPHAKVFTAYAASDIIAFPSKTETQGLSLLEGLALGKPAVCINELGVKHILTKGGFLTNDSQDEYVERLIQLIDDRSVYDRLSAEATERGAEFSAEEMARRAISVYQSLLGVHS
ncbi:glycosyltransferase family 4 protein [bacterium]|nr:glycosyltransferase family 4 protein [bacterium]